MQNKIDPFKGSVKDPNSKSQAKKMKKLEAANVKKTLKAQKNEASFLITTGVATLNVMEDMTESDDIIALKSTS
jgi:tryptophanyl-tRNA synthetase